MAASEEAPERVRIAIRQLGHWEWRERSIAISSLVEERHPAAIPPLIEVLRADWVNDVRIEAAGALGELGDERAIRPVVDQLRRDSRMQLYATIALGKIMRRLETQGSRHPDAIALRSVWRHFQKDEHGNTSDPRAVVYNALSSVFNGGVGEANAGLYVRQLRALASNLK